MQVFGEAKGVQLIFAAIGRVDPEEDEESLRDYIGSLLVFKMAQPNCGKLALMIDAGLVPLVQALVERTHRTFHQAAVHKNALGIMRLIASNETHRSALCGAGVVPLVMASMAKFCFEEKVQQYAAEVLGHLTRNSSTAAALPAEMVGRVVKAMEVFRNGVSLQRACMFALMCFLQNRHNVPAVVAVDGVPIIMHSLATHGLQAGVLGVMECGFVVLSCLSTHDASLAYMQDHEQSHGGVVDLALRAVREYARSGDLKVVDHAIGVLASCVERYPLMHARFRASGGVREMRSACELRGLSPENRAVAQRILRACGV